MLKTSRIIIPTSDNDGSSNAVIIDQTITRMCNMFGGVTSWEGKGFWTNSNGRLFKDDVTIIESATTVKAKSALQDFAKEVLEMTDQEAVYVQHAGGDVEIIDKD